jgi:hypothetical protein
MNKFAAIVANQTTEPVHPRLESTPQPMGERKSHAYTANPEPRPAAIVQSFTNTKDFNAGPINQDVVRKAPKTSIEQEVRQCTETSRLGWNAGATSDVVHPMAKTKISSAESTSLHTSLRGYGGEVEEESPSLFSVAARNTSKPV